MAGKPLISRDDSGIFDDSDEEGEGFLFRLNDLREESRPLTPQIDETRALTAAEIREIAASPEKTIDVTPEKEPTPQD